MEAVDETQARAGELPTLKGPRRRQGPQPGSRPIRQSWQ